MACCRSRSCPRAGARPAPSRRPARPERDRDGDGIADARDRCQSQPEDKDGWKDGDSCPDPDNDSDGIPDVLDRCPGEPETINSTGDDGCPDTADATKATEQTFTRGRELMQQSQHAAACTQFEQSHKLDPQFGTQYNLAGCYDKSGKLATAWNLYRELSRSDSNPARRGEGDRAGDRARRPRPPARPGADPKAPPECGCT